MRIIVELKKIENCLRPTKMSKKESKFLERTNSVLSESKALSSSIICKRIRNEVNSLLRKNNIPEKIKYSRNVMTCVGTSVPKAKVSKNFVLIDNQKKYMTPLNKPDTAKGIVYGINYGESKTRLCLAGYFNDKPDLLGASQCTIEAVIKKKDSQKLVSQKNIVSLERRSPHEHSMCSVDKSNTSNSAHYLEIVSSAHRHVTFEKNLASDRLKRLREKLQRESLSQPSDCFKRTNLEDTHNPSSKLTQSRACKDVSKLDSPNQSSEGKNLNSCEPMEVDEPMDIEDTKMTLQKVSSVGHNLMRLSQNRSTGLKLAARDKWCIVLDTNVWLRDLHVVEYITGVEFQDFIKAIIIVPYCVLQELDKLKNSKTISVEARKAIEFINKALCQDPPLVAGQSATEDHQHLIYIKSADDCIINCCLQVKDTSTRLILLSNDKCLLNKAIVSQINCCSTKEIIKCCEI